MLEFDWKGIRLKEFFKKRDISVDAAAKALGVSRQTVYQYFKSEQLTRDVVNNILKTFHAAENAIFEAKVIKGSESSNQDLLKKGISISGLINEKNDFSNQFIDLKNGNVLLVTPLIEGYLREKFISNIFNTTQMLTDFPSQSIIIEKFQEGEFLSFRVVNDSMNDGTSQSILDGSIVTGRKIDLLRERFFENKNQDFVLVHKEGVLIKRVLSFDIDSGKIKCGSLNPDKENFPDLSININDCILIFIIINVSTARAK